MPKRRRTFRIMRFFAAGLFAIIFPIACFAQVRGEVESVGFSDHFRPDCWTPLIVKVTPETSEPGDYIIQVIQDDLDKDLVLSERRITVTGNKEGQSPQPQQYFMYFKPQPTGLVVAGDTAKDLQDKLKVFICTTSGKQIAQLPVTPKVITDIEPRGAGFTLFRGTKLILYVAEGNNLPSWRDYENAVGLNENVLMIKVRPDQLPEDPRGYDAVDAILWLGADPDALNRPNPEKMDALKEFIRSGGQLVICQPAQRDANLAFGDLMPVIVSDTVDRPGVPELHSILSSKTIRDIPAILPSTPVRIARATPKPDSIVSRWITWDTGDKSPYLARMAYGLGSVTWVAQDLGSTVLTAAIRSGWPGIWDTVFDWPNLTQVITDRTNPVEKGFVDAYDPGAAVDIGASLLSGMEHTRRASLLITLAVVFFLVYWVVAGPGVYLYLLGKKRTQLSWFLFGASALVAAGLTVLVVQLVLRGSPVVHHFSIVQMAPNQPAVVYSRFGLYIPRDNFQHIELKETAPGHFSYIAPFAMQPAHHAKLTNVEFPARMKYQLPVRGLDSTAPIAVDIPYRSTLKKLEARWTGTLTGGVDGSAKLRDRSFGSIVEGSLTNGTGKLLRNVYIAFAYPESDGLTQDQVFFMSSWEPGLTIKLEEAFIKAKLVDTTRNNMTGQPDRDPKVVGWIAAGDVSWCRYWFAKLQRSEFGDAEVMVDDSSDTAPTSFAVLSLFDRLPPRRNPDDTNRKRIELLRRGARHMDLSHLLSAGKMIVLAEAQGPLPFPLEVEGDIIPGEGTVFYQFVLPLDRSERVSPTTQPEVEG